MLCLQGVLDAHDLRILLQQAVEAYGGDLPVKGPAPRRAAPARSAEPPETARPRPTPARAPRAGTSARVARPAASPPSPATNPPVATVESAAGPALDPAAALQALRDSLGDCSRCKLCKGRTNVVFGEGDARARVMFVGEAPGFHEDQQARPFVGAAGQLLDRIIENGMGLRRAEVYIANVNKCRPPDNREPEPDEVAACLPFLREQVRIVRPEVLVCLGRVASSNLLGTSLPMRTLRGRPLTYEGIPVVVTWHPAYLLRNPAAKAETWEDVKRVNRMLGRPERPTGPPPPAESGG